VVFYDVDTTISGKPKAFVVEQAFYNNSCFYKSCIQKKIVA
jgi:hypothetical protein